MKRISQLMALLAGCLCILPLAAQDNELWYTTPATQWEDALPVGNGRLGAMVFGDTRCERIQLNENTLYSGEPDMAVDGIRLGEHKAWPEGEVRGLKARGGLTVDLRWKDGLLLEAVLTASHTGSYRLAYRGATHALHLFAGQRVSLLASDFAQ